MSHVNFYQSDNSLFAVICLTLFTLSYRPVAAKDKNENIRAKSDSATPARNNTVSSEHIPLGNP